MIPGLPRVAGFAPQQARPQASLPQYSYTVVRTYPHDRDAFTQGLQFLEGVFYEGTGLNGRSSIRKVKVESGEVLQIHALPADIFGEGITELHGQLYQLTYQSELGFVYDLASFRQLRTFDYKGEGWGLTHDGTRLIMSDGSPRLRFIDPVTLKETGRITVRDPSGPVENLNELEYIEGEIFANVWQTDRIARISPKDGRVTGWIDLSGLLPASERASENVLNGIAYDAAGDRLFVTGKLWPRVFQITLVPRGAARGGA
jgi:glutamine cyclotransferase